MSIGYLYVTTNDVNDIVYVGQSGKLDSQSVRSYLGSGDYLRQAITEIGADRFSKQIVAYYDDQVELDYAEVLLIAELKANGIALYNGGVGGPRAQQAFVHESFQRFSALPAMPTEWLEAMKSHPHEVKRLLSTGSQLSSDDFYYDLERQLFITQDLSAACPRCSSQPGEVCRTKTGKPARNHAGRRR